MHDDIRQRMKTKKKKSLPKDMLFEAVPVFNSPAAGQMLYDPNKDPLWPEIKVCSRPLLPVVLVQSIVSNCVQSHFDYWAPSLPASYCLSHFTRAFRTKFPASDARKLRACTTCASSRSTRVLRQVCARSSLEFLLGACTPHRNR